jgi:hypothetical protein
MGRVIFCLAMLGLAPLTACNEAPPSPETIADQHRFQMGCRAEDAQGLERNMAYCGHNSRSKN